MCTNVQRDLFYCTQCMDATKAISPEVARNRLCHDNRLPLTASDICLASLISCSPPRAMSWTFEGSAKAVQLQSLKAKLSFLFLQTCTSSWLALEVLMTSMVVLRGPKPLQKQEGPGVCVNHVYTKYVSGELICLHCLVKSDMSMTIQQISLARRTMSLLLSSHLFTSVSNLCSSITYTNTHTYTHNKHTSRKRYIPKLWKSVT